MELCDEGCPVERHELLDHEWIDKGRLQRMMQDLWAEHRKKNPEAEAAEIG